ncbi:uncharacterized protein LOC120012369 isoform X4 [Tripterygium wilfordii]|uniref:uncharacterized protein LOC120012369 isoform X4 n=1 Tax=Tripterygium wilfordii TaxID=458696 RepID=UPI0018F81449|nr:uncharacterized protein LOC120012369 isoform X4 [Tripterygium wilfordii]
MDMLHHISLSRLEDKRETVSGKSCFCSGNSTSKLNVAFVMLIVFPLPCRSFNVLFGKCPYCSESVAVRIDNAMK